MNLIEIIQQAQKFPRIGFRRKGWINYWYLNSGDSIIDARKNYPVKLVFDLVECDFDVLMADDWELTEPLTDR